LNGPSPLVDNIKFVGSTTRHFKSAADSGMQKNHPGLTGFIGSANIYGRSQLTTVNASEFGSAEVIRDYSFTLLDFQRLTRFKAMMEFIPGPATRQFGRGLWQDQQPLCSFK